ncbi:MAG: hypothetical protein MI810_13335 [Flavobacteriales bacterium]|nr:hypothetical protein [Flavobacteriales bacterium]
MTYHYILLFLFSILFVNLNAQTFNRDVEIESKPYHDDVYKADYSEKKGIKEEILFKSTSPAVNTSDTLMIYHYDEKGREIKKIKFDENGRDYVSITEWRGDLKLTVKSHDCTTLKPKIHSFYTYNSNNLVSEHRVIHFRENGDTSYIQLAIFTYDSQQNLIDKKRYAAQSSKYLFKSISQQGEFKYDSAGNLIKYSHFSGMGKMRPVEYNYYNGTLLDSSKRYSLSDTAETLYDYCYYKYNEKGQLIYKETPTKIRIGDDNWGVRTSHYEYDEQGHLTHAYAFKDDQKLVDVKYTFEKGRIKQIEAQKLNEKYSSEIYFFFRGRTVKEVYYRNEHNHVIKHERYLDGVLSDISTTVYTYY